MARPDTINDIEIDQVEFATFNVDKIATDGTLLKAYGAFLEAMQKAENAVFKTDYRGVTFLRTASKTEQLKQLDDDQAEWDRKQGFYEQWANGEALDQEYKVDWARQHAVAENLPRFTWDKLGKPEADDDLKDAVQDVIDSIDAL